MFLCVWPNLLEDMNSFPSQDFSAFFNSTCAKFATISRKFDGIEDTGMFLSDCPVFQRSHDEAWSREVSVQTSRPPEVYTGSGLSRIDSGCVSLNPSKIILKAKRIYPQPFCYGLLLFYRSLPQNGVFSKLGQQETKMFINCLFTLTNSPVNHKTQ